MKFDSAFAPLLATPEPPELGPGPRAGVMPLAQLRPALDAAFTKRPLASAEKQSARALVLLWHDHHDAAHEIVQDMATADAAYVHAILHRREPDHGNARYWFHRVGQHPCHVRLAEQAGEAIASGKTEALRAKLLPRGAWDAFAFVDACEEGAQAGLLREIQAMEFRVLLEFLTGDQN